MLENKTCPVCNSIFKGQRGINIHLRKSRCGKIIEDAEISDVDSISIFDSLKFLFYYTKCDSIQGRISKKCCYAEMYFSSAA